MFKHAPHISPALSHFTRTSIDQQYITPDTLRQVQGSSVSEILPPTSRCFLHFLRYYFDVVLVTVDGCFGESHSTTPLVSSKRIYAQLIPPANGTYGLYLDASLFEGTSACFPTFENEALCLEGTKGGGRKLSLRVGLEVGCMRP